MKKVKGGFNFQAHQPFDTVYVVKPDDEHNTIRNIAKGSKAKIAAFDLDHTVVRPSGSKKFSSGRNDWEFMYTEVPDKLRALHDDGFQIVVFTNQAGIDKGHTNPDHVTGKLMDIGNQVGVPLQAFLAAKEDLWRKPNTSIFEFFLKENGIKREDVDPASVYVGDAAGRPKDWRKGAKKDFSASDRMFAANIGLDFFTPEEYFLGQASVPFSWGSKEPEVILRELEAAADESKEKGHNEVGWIGKGDMIHADGAEVIVFVGSPAIGKSSWAQANLVPHGYVWVNQDTLKTKAKCVKAVKDALAKGKSVVVDNTNRDAATRSLYIAEAKKAGVPCRCFFFQADKELVTHLNLFRVKLTKGERSRLSRVVFNMYFAKMEMPSTNEGFEDVASVHFVPSFASDDDRRLFLEWV